MASMEQVTELINDCWAYFKTTTLQPKTIKSWAEELAYMDVWNAGNYIRHKFKQADAFPANFPKVVKGIYHDWLRQQPKAQDNAGIGCPMCMDGVIHAIRDGYCFAFRCGHCRPVGIVYREATRDWLADNGYALDWQHDFGGKIDRAALSKYKNNYGQMDEVPF